MRKLTQVGSVVVVMVLALALAGCRGKKEDASPETGGNPLKPDPSGGAPAKNDVQRGGQKLVNENLMRNLGTLYITYPDDNQGRRPRTLEEFKTYVQADKNYRNEAAALDKGWLVFVLDPPPSANQVLAYEKDPYEKWMNRLVLFGGGSVELMSEADFRAALKRQ